MHEASGQWVPYGTAAATALREQISALKVAEPLKPVTVVVNSNQVGVSIRRQLASGSVGAVCGAGAGLIAVTFLTPYRLAELLGAAALAARARRPVSTPVLTAAVRASLTDEPGSFGPVAHHPATELALVAAYRELRDLDEPALELLAKSSRRAAEVVRVARAVRNRLVSAWYDEEDLMTAAAEAVAGGGGLADMGDLVLYLPQRLSRHAATLLRTAGDATSLRVLAGSTGVRRADAEVERSAALLGIELGPAPESAPLAGVVSAESTRIVTTSDADDEVRAAVRIVVDAVRGGMSMDRIAVLHAAPEPYGRLLADHLSAAGVVTNGSATVPLAATMASRTLLGLLDLSTTGFRRDDVLAWITDAPMLHGGHPVPATAWEQVSRQAGVVGGRLDWDQRLAHLAEALVEEAHRLDQRDEVPAARVERLRMRAERVRLLQRFVTGLIDRLADVAEPQPWGDRVQWAKHLLADLLGGPSARTRWPEGERRAADRLDLALDRLGVLDQVEGPVGLDVFARTLTVELETDLGRVGRFGEGVLLGPVSMGVGLDLDLLVVVGMAEGTFPSSPAADSLLPDEDREVTAGALALRNHHTDRLHHHFLATMGGAATHVLGVPRGDLRRSRERVPSRWVLDVASELAGTRWWTEDLLVADVPWATHSASFDAALRAAETPSTAQEHHLRHLMAAAPARPDLHLIAATIDDVLAAGVAALDDRSSTLVTRFDGNLAGLAVPSPIERGTSATRLEAWAKCPFHYFLSTVLRVEPIEDPEDALEITPLDRGNLVHEALERFLVEVIEAGRVPDPAEPWSESDHHRLGQIAAACCDDLDARGLTGRPLFWQRARRQVLAELDRFLLEDDKHRSTYGARPLAAELPFGFDGSDPVAFALPDGRAVPLRGRADRVDRTDSGDLLVLDYKTGGSDRYRGLGPDDPHQGGQRLQLAVYGEAARQYVGEPDAPVRADYWFTSTRGGFKKVGYGVTGEIRDQVGAAVATIVDGIEAGLFPARPKVGDTSPWPDCTSCDPDNLGTAELGRQWARKASDPVLAAYVALAEPDGAVQDLGEGSTS